MYCNCPKSLISLILMMPYDGVHGTRMDTLLQNIGIEGLTKCIFPLEATPAFTINRRALCVFHDGVAFATFVEVQGPTRTSLVCGVGSSNQFINSDPVLDEVLDNAAVRLSHVKSLSKRQKMEVFSDLSVLRLFREVFSQHASEPNEAPGEQFRKVGHQLV
jgi:hypothetical protein